VGEGGNHFWRNCGGWYRRLGEHNGFHSTYHDFLIFIECAGIIQPIEALDGFNWHIGQERDADATIPWAHLENNVAVRIRCGGLIGSALCGCRQTQRAEAQAQGGQEQQKRGSVFDFVFIVTSFLHYNIIDPSYFINSQKLFR